MTRGKTRSEYEPWLNTECHFSKVLPQNHLASGQLERPILLQVLLCRVVVVMGGGGSSAMSLGVLLVQ